MKNEIPNDYFGCCIIFEEENSIVRMVLISQYGVILEGVEQHEKWLEFDTRGFIKY